MRSLVDMLREIEQAFDRMKNPEPEKPVFQNYEPVTNQKLTLSYEWLRLNGVERLPTLRAMYEAEAEAERNDLTWEDALHRVVNRAVRSNRAGWESYSGNWLLFLKS